MVVTPQMLLNGKNIVRFQYENENYEIKRAPYDGVCVGSIDVAGQVYVGWFPKDFPFFDDVNSMNDFCIYEVQRSETEMQLYH